MKFWLIIEYFRETQCTRNAKQIEGGTEAMKGRNDCPCPVSSPIPPPRKENPDANSIQPAGSHQINILGII